MRVRSAVALSAESDTGKAPTTAGSAHRAAVPHATAAHRSHAWRLTTLTRTRACRSVPLFSVCGGRPGWAMSAGNGRVQLPALGFGERDRFPLVCVPLDRDHARFGGNLS